MTRDNSLEAAAIEALFDSGEFGLILADTHQIVYFVRGKLAQPIALNKPLCRGFPPLVGMAQKLSNLQAERTATLIIPRVSIVQGEAKYPKNSFEVLWSRASSRYTIFIYPGMSGAEEEIAQTLRIKRLAEKSLDASSRWSGNPAAHTSALAPAKAASPSPLASLTARERDIVRLLICGHSNKNMARILSLSPKTVEAHRARAIKRLGLKTSAELIKLVVEVGLPESSG